MLSPSTELYDRRDKLAHFQRIPSLQAFVLVSQEERRVDLYQRLDDGRWALSTLREGGIPLPSIGAELTMEALYADADRLAPLDGTSSTA